MNVVKIVAYTNDGRRVIMCPWSMGGGGGVFSESYVDGPGYVVDDEGFTDEEMGSLAETVKSTAAVVASHFVTEDKIVDVED